MLNRKEAFQRFAKPGEKENKNYGHVFHFFRYLSFWLSLPFIVIPLTPNQITLLTNILQVTATGIIAYADGYEKLYGVLLYFIGGIFDFVDGNIARYRNMQSNKGVFYDQIGHVFVGPLYYVAIALAAYGQTNEMLYLYCAIALAMFVPLMSFQIGVTPVYYTKKTTNTNENTATVNQEGQGVEFYLRKLISWFYHFKIEILVIAILLNILPELALVSVAYFVVRFFLQLYIDQKQID